MHGVEAALELVEVLPDLDIGEGREEVPELGHQAGHHARGVLPDHDSKWLLFHSG